VALLPLFIPTSLFWATYEQLGNTIALWADDYTDRTVNLLSFIGNFLAGFLGSFWSTMEKPAFFMMIAAVASAAAAVIWAFDRTLRTALKHGA
jgi:dipeptide/tripeptide permease